MWASKKMGGSDSVRLAHPPMRPKPALRIMPTQTRKGSLRMPSRILNQTIADLRPAANSVPPYEGLESRRSLRVELPFPATVRGIDADGERFTMDTVLDNLSAGGLYLRLARPVRRGMKLFIVVRLSTCRDPEVPAARVALQGVVLRAEPQPDGRCGVAVVFQRHRFLYAVPQD